MKIPKFRCEDCGDTINIEFTADPYQSEIEDNYTEHFYCHNCIQKSAREI